MFPKGMCPDPDKGGFAKKSKHTAESVASFCISLIRKKSVQIAKKSLISG